MHRGRYNFDSGVCGELSVKDNEVVTTVQATVLTQITVFTVNGFSQQMTPDHTNDHITIERSGVYEAGFSIHITNSEAQSQIIDVSLFANN